MRKLAVVACSVALSLLSAAVRGQGDYPQKPIHLIVPFAPGGASDFVARIIGPALSDELKQPIIVDNKSGAAGNIGMEAAAKSPPDGYTIFIGNVGATAINPSIFGNLLRVKPQEDFIAVSKIADVADVLVLSNDVPVKTAKEFVQYAAERNGQLNFASPGSGSQNRLEMEYFMKATGISMQHIPYKGGAGPAITDLLGGHTQAMFTTLPSAMQFIKAGRLRALAVTTAQRVPELPSVPTLDELGYPGMVSTSWQGVFVPRGTPSPIVGKLFSVTKKVMGNKSIQERLAVGGAIASTSNSPEEFAAYLKSESERWGNLVRERNIGMD
ncbi:MAG TPA: tripartite tricarboxylate transporter substrate binding protein [Acidiferrobacterales bacterium]|nr:tripartite tricarboxylate transporter substrate binding protein [Acidiferrobacterales bacterium]